MSLSSAVSLSRRKSQVSRSSLQLPRLPRWEKRGDQNARSHWNILEYVLRLTLNLEILVVLDFLVKSHVESRPPWRLGFVTLFFLQ